MPHAHQVDLAVHRPTVREHLLAVLREADGFHIRRVVESAAQTVRLVQFSAPNLLLLGTALPDAPWQHTVRCIRTARPSLPLVAVGPREDERLVAELFVQGLSGCVSDCDGPDRVLAVLGAAVEGEVRFSRRMLRELIEPRPSDAVLAALSKRQRDVLHLLALGYDNRRIAAALDLAEGTVRNYVSEVYRRIGVSSRIEAAQWAWEHGAAQAA